MQIFSELYGAYFRTVARLLAKASLTEQEMYRVIGEEAFQDSMLFLPQKLRPESPESWGLLQRLPDGKLVPVTHREPPGFVTLLQKRWLKAKLCDPRMRLFLSDEGLIALEEYLKEVKPLFLPDMFRYFDMFADGDRYDSEHYRRVFRTVLEAVHSGEILQVHFISGKGSQLNGEFLPLKLEYSQKNDKFRVYCCRMAKGRAVEYGLINLGRVLHVRGTGRKLPSEQYLQDCFQNRRCKKPVRVEVTGERNGIERFMVEFASFEKRAERDSATGRCTVWIWYDPQDETELLIRLLGFGPVLEILGPPEFRRQAAERVRRQHRLLEQASSAAAHSNEDLEK